MVRHMPRHFAGDLDLDSIGGQIRAARNFRGWTQAELAERLQVTQATVSHWEGNQQTPGAKSISRLNAILGLSLSSIPRADKKSEPSPSDVDPRFVAEQIRAARITRGWTPKQLAEQLGVSGRAIWRWENEGLIPRLVSRRQISVVRDLLLDVDLEGGREPGPTPDDLDSELIGRQMRAVRIERGWTQIRLAVHLGLPLRTIELWEKGLARPGAERVRQINALLGLV
jgi:transcriptional regulator with XRE-family HTH domain